MYANSQTIDYACFWLMNMLAQAQCIDNFQILSNE